MAISTKKELEHRFLYRESHNTIMVKGGKLVTDMFKKLLLN